MGEKLITFFQQKYWRISDIIFKKISDIIFKKISDIIFKKKIQILYLKNKIFFSGNFAC